jgi:hypothetical protein
VTLASFTVEAQGAGALLRWSTATEQNNAYFAVESSRDGRTFTTLSQVPGHGTSAQPQRYQYLDANAGRQAGSTIYYRLRQVDKDGTSSYSPVVTLLGQSVAAFTGTSLQAWPNPAVMGSVLMVNGAPEGGLVQVYTVRGQVVATATADANGAATLPVATLQAGIYVVRSGARSTRLVVAN